MRTFLMLPLMLSAFKGVVASKIMRNRFISVTGGMCYTMYLIHFPLIHLLCDQLFIPTNHYWLTYIFLALIVMPIIWVATALFFLLIEKPCMDKEWSQKLVAYFKRDKPIVS